VIPPAVVLTVVPGVPVEDPPLTVVPGQWWNFWRNSRYNSQWWNFWRNSRYNSQWWNLWRNSRYNSEWWIIAIYVKNTRYW
jgi:hypothetical protein